MNTTHFSIENNGFPVGHTDWVLHRNDDGMTVHGPHEAWTLEGFLASFAEHPASLTVFIHVDGHPCGIAVRTASDVEKAIAAQEVQ